VSTSSIPRNEARERLIEGFLGHLARLGPAGAQPKDVCAELGVSKALVNYHFGSRDGLIAECMAVGYERYVDALMAAADAAGTNPEARLRAWMECQIDWTKENRGLAAALNFPNVASGLPQGIPAEVSTRLRDAGTRNMFNLFNLVRDVRAADRPDGNPGDDVETGFDSVVVGWMTLGYSVWNGGRHEPTGEWFPEHHVAARKHIVETAIAIARRSPVRN
jgi:AcrR family transcriptional regulator